MHRNRRAGCPWSDLFVLFQTAFCYLFASEEFPHFRILRLVRRKDSFRIDILFCCACILEAGSTWQRKVGFQSTEIILFFFNLLELIVFFL